MVGAAGLGREIVEAIRVMNSQRATWDLVGFLDDDRALEGTSVAGLPVLGPVDAVTDHPDAHLVLAVGNASNVFARARLVSHLALEPDRYATVIHPAAALSPSTAVGPGTVILAGVVATADVEIGPHVVLMPQVLLTHDDRVGDYATVAGGAKLAGRVNVEQGAFLGAGSMVREYTTIGAWAVVGMGAVVTHDVPSGEVWTGCPARFVRAVDVPGAR